MALVCENSTLQIVLMMALVCDFSTIQIILMAKNLISHNPSSTHAFGFVHRFMGAPVSRGASYYIFLNGSEENLEKKL